MASVLLRALSFALVIAAGILLRSTGFVPENAGDLMKKLLINITLPAAILKNFSAIHEISPSMLLLVGIGILMNVILIAAAILASGRAAPGPERAMNILCFSGYNIGAFCLPFVQSFLPAIGSVTACMLDVGNSIMCTGATYAFAAEYTAGEKRGFDLGAFGKRLISSVPLDCYILMFLLTSLKIRLPEAVLTLIEPAAAANTFVAMLMLGLLFHLEFKRAYLAKVVKILAFRLSLAAVFATVLYAALPFEPAVRQALVLLCFAPMSALAPAYTGSCGGDEGMASCANSLSILCSLAVIPCLLPVLGIA